MVVDFNPVTYFNNLFDIVEDISLVHYNLTWFAKENLKVDGEFDDGTMLLIKLDDILQIEDKLRQTFLLTTSLDKLPVVKKLLEEAGILVTWIGEPVEEGGLTLLKFWVTKDHISTEVEAETIG